MNFYYLLLTSVFAFSLIKENPFTENSISIGENVLKYVGLSAKDNSSSKSSSSKKNKDSDDSSSNDDEDGIMNKMSSMSTGVWIGVIIILIEIIAGIAYSCQ